MKQDQQHGSSLNQVLRRMAQLGNTTAANPTTNLQTGIIKVKRKSQQPPMIDMPNRATNNKTAMLEKDAIKFQDQRQAGFQINRPQTQQQDNNIPVPNFNAFNESSMQRQLLKQITSKKRGQSKAPVQHRRRRRDEPLDSEEAEEIESSSQQSEDQSYEPNDGPSPAEQYGLILRRERQSSSRVSSPTLEKYKNMARQIKQGLQGTSSPIKEYSNSKIRLKESTESLKSTSFNKKKGGIFGLGPRMSGNNLDYPNNSPSTKNDPNPRLVTATSKQISQDNTRISTQNYLSGKLQGYSSNITIQEQQQESQQKTHPKIPSLKGKINHAIIGKNGLSSQHQQPVTSKTEALLTGITGLTTIDGEKQTTQKEEFNNNTPNQNNYMSAPQGAMPSVSGCYPLYTCQTGTVGYYDFCHFHMSEKDMLTILDYRRKTGEGNHTQQETQSFALFNSQAPYMFLDHSQLANYRNTNENRFIFATVDEMDRAVSERNSQFVKQHGSQNNTMIKKQGNKTQNQEFNDWKQQMQLKVTKIHSL